MIVDAHLPLLELVEDDQNYNRHSEAAVRKMVQKIGAVGFTAPMLVEAGTKKIKGGHLRRLALLAIKGAGMSEPPGIQPGWLVPCRVGDWDELQSLQVLIGDNPDPEELDYDPRLLAPLLSTLNQQGRLAGAGYDAKRLQQLLSAAERVEKRAAVQDDVPGPGECATRCHSGDVWIMGAHRMLVGDACDEAEVKALCADLPGPGLVDMVWTDPPYGVAYQGVWHGPEKVRDRLKNDESDEAGLADLWTRALRAAVAVSKPGAPWYVMGAANPMPHSVAIRVLRDLGVWRQTLVWAKSTFVVGRADYHHQFEHLFYGWDPRSPHFFLDDRTQGDVWHFDRPAASPDHPTSKPVELVVKCLTNSSVPGARCYDPFLGSGTLIAAAEQTNRAALGCEIDPQLGDVVLTRWERLTGHRAELARAGRQSE